MAMLKIGDHVDSKYGPGKVVAITLVTTEWSNHTGGCPIAQVAWELLLHGWAVVDLDNGHWCYGDQISPISLEVARG